MSTLAFLGTGLIGGNLARAAAQRGDTVVAWNRTAQKAEALAPLGVRVAASPAEAVQGAERVHLAFPDDPVVEAVLAECTDALGDAVVVDHTTTGPRPTAARSVRLAAEGVAYLHAPVFMSPQMCLDARGLMLVAGPKDVWDRAGAGLAAMTGKVRYLGERGDLAAAFKLFGNALLISLVAGLADVLSMAADLDIAPQQAMTLLDDFNPAGVLSYRGKAMSKGRYAPAAFELAMARKDVRLMVEAAEQRALAVLPAIAERMDALIARGLGADDLGVLSVDAVAKSS